MYELEWNLFNYIEINEGKNIKDQLLPEQPSPVDYKEIMKVMHERFDLKYIAMTFRNQLSVNHLILIDRRDTELLYTFQIIFYPILTGST